MLFLEKGQLKAEFLQKNKKYQNYFLLFSSRYDTIYGKVYFRQKKEGNI